jgi:hypothetical protein
MDCERVVAGETIPEMSHPTGRESPTLPYAVLAVLGFIQSFYAFA